MSGIGSSRARRLRRSQGLALCLFALLLAVPSCALPREFEPYATAEQAALDYANGILTGDIDLASRAAGQELTVDELAQARVEILGLDADVPGASIVMQPDAEVVMSRDGEAAEATVFVVESYVTAEGASVPVELSEGAPEVWVTAEEPWRVMRTQDQKAAMWFVIVVLLVGFAIVGTVVVVLIRIANQAQSSEA